MAVSNREHILKIEHLSNLKSSNNVFLGLIIFFVLYLLSRMI